jgi:hypothetical protein
MNLQPNFNLAEMSDAIAMLTNIHELPVALSLLDLAGPHPQRNLVRIICENLSTMLPAKLPSRQRDMLAVRNEKDFVPWYGALPSKPLGNYIPPNQFRVAFKFQFGLETLRNNVGEKKCEACKQQMDPFGMHGAKCHTEGGLTKRHNVTRDMLHKLAMDAGKQSETERKEILNDGTNRRPADVYIQNYSMIQALAVDVAVVDGGAPNGIKNKEIEKRRKYLVDCANNDVLFEPFVLDSFGRIGSCAVKILRKLSYKYAEKFDITVGSAFWRLKNNVVLASRARKLSKKEVKKM